VTRAIWGIIYDLPEPGRGEYLTWFHDVHMPEKMARPGYAWAAHYEVVSREGHHVSSRASGQEGNAGQGYIALFGGEDTQVFLNPSPAQIKPRQTPLTREMMGRRIGQRSFIAAEEWRIEGGRPAGLEDSPLIHVTCCDASHNDEAFGAWCVQELVPALRQDPALCVLTKMLAATGPAKHVVLAGFQSMPRAQSFAPPMATHINGSPFPAQRISHLRSVMHDDD